MAITKIEDIRIDNKEIELELPPFTDGTPITVLFRPVEIATLMRTGVVPNELIFGVQKLYGDASNKNKNNSVKELTNFIYDLAKKTIISPTVTEIEEAGRELNETQLTFILNYCQGGVKAIEKFRNESSIFGSSDNVETTKGETE